MDLMDIELQYTVKRIAQGDNRKERQNAERDRHQSRIDIENLLHCKINLQLWVKVRSNYDSRSEESVITGSDLMAISKTEGIVLRYTNLGEAIRYSQYLPETTENKDCKRLPETEEQPSSSSEVLFSVSLYI